MAVVLAFLRKQGIHIFPYLDNWLVKGQSRAQVEVNTCLIQSTFSALGLLLNVQNSILILVQRIEFIRVVLNLL